MQRFLRNAPVMLALMTLALALLLRGGVLPFVLAGALGFGVLALARPDLGLLFVILTAPIYLIPAAFSGLRADPENPFRLPLHEIVLLIVLGTTLARWLWHRQAWNGERRTTAEHSSHITDYSSLATRYAPHLLFLLAGILGVLLAAERGRALREFRWLIVEPLVFYALVQFQIRQRNSDSNLAPADSRLATAFVLSGALVGLLGLLQFAGFDLVPLLGRKECFAPDGGPCANVIADGSVRRALSVYGHPNNLGLYLGRVWPIAAALAISDFRFWILEQPAPRRANIPPKRGMFWALAALLALGGIVVSFSRGAWLGALVALAVLALGTTNKQRLPAGINSEDRRSRIEDQSSILDLRSSVLARWLIVFLAIIAIVAALALALRGDVTAGSTPVRLLLWREALGYLARHPLGIGLDQFGFYHDPNSGLSLIDPALRGTSEEFAAHPHNLLLDIGLRLGPLGWVAFGWLLARFFRAGWSGVSSTRGAIALGATAAMAAALTHGLVDNFYFVPDLAIAFWLLLALKESRRE